jgi:hypothetical protein
MARAKVSLARPDVSELSRKRNQGREESFESHQDAHQEFFVNKSLMVESNVLHELP